MTTGKPETTVLDRDHARGCQGREYACSCGHDEAVDAELRRLRAALERLRGCDWTITPLDRMDAVRNIARAALEGRDDRPHP